jgi:peroxiredoxin
VFSIFVFHLLQGGIISRRNHIGGFSVVILLVLIVLTAFVFRPTDIEGSLRPAVSVRTLAGTPLRLSSPFYRRHILLLFTPSCPHCRQELEHMRELYSTLSRGELFAISLSDAASTVRLADSLRLPFPVLMDDSMSVRNAFDVERVPQMLFVDDRDIIVRVVRGSRSFRQDSLMLRWFDGLGAPAGSVVGSDGDGDQGP